MHVSAIERGVPERERLPCVGANEARAVGQSERFSPRVGRIDTGLMDVHARCPTAGLLRHEESGSARSARDLDDVRGVLDSQPAEESAVLVSCEPGKLADVLSERLLPDRGVERVGRVLVGAVVVTGLALVH